MCGKYFLHGQQRKIRKMFVIDRVELNLLHQLNEVRKFHGDNPVRLQQNLHAGDEAVQIRHLRQHVIAEQEVGFYSSRGKFFRALSIEKLHESRHAFLDGDGRHIRSGLNSQSRYARRDEILQKIAVVAGKLNHLAFRSERKTLDHFFRVRFCMSQPTLGKGRKIGVLAKDGLHAHILLQLHQEALFTDENMKRIKRLHLIQLPGRQVTLTQRRHAQVDKRMSHTSTAKT